VIAAVIASCAAQSAHNAALWLTNRACETERISQRCRRAKATLIYRRAGNLRAVHLLLGHTKIRA
jgi:hypothetical protein